jgi:hypothetical protein
MGIQKIEHYWYNLLVPSTRKVKDKNIKSYNAPIKEAVHMNYMQV